MTHKLNQVISREEDFSRWYTDVVTKAKLMAYGPTKGTVILRPYGYAIWENIQKLLDKEFKKVGVENVYFPLLIPEKLFKKEQEHISGFAPEVLTVTQVGAKKLEEKLIIRPTSEVLMSTFFAKEVKSWRDLPIIYNQWVNVMRWEKTTRPFLRVSEFLWQEGHTLHQTAAEAEAFTLKILKIYEKFMIQKLRLPIIIGRKTEHEKFAGAETTYTLESLMQDGQSLQVGTSHYLGQNFAKAYGIKFQDQEGRWKTPYGTSWGVSIRLIGALIMTHGDDFGLVLPWAVAPFQIAIVLVNQQPEILSAAQKIAKQLKRYRVFMDQSDKSFGYKMSEADIEGIPLRIELGARDLVNGNVTISRRDTHQKEVVKIKEIPTIIKKIAYDYDENLLSKAQEYSRNHTSQGLTLVDYQKRLKTKPGYVLLPFCGRVECEKNIKATTSTNSRCIPLKQKNHSDQNCFYCGQKATCQVYFGRAY